MATLVVQLEDEVIEKIQHRANRNGRSIEEEVHEILRDAVKSEDGSSVGLGTQLAAIFEGVGIDEEIAELRGHPVVPITLEGVR